MQNIQVRLVGVSPMLVNAPTTVNPLSKESKVIKEITEKRKKSDSEQEELLRLKFHASLYIDAELGPYLPAYNCFKSGQEAAKLVKRGRDWERGVGVVGYPGKPDKVKIDYKGTRDPDAMWKQQGTFVDIRDCGVGGKRITVARPIFPQWSVDVGFTIAEDILNPADVLDHLVQAGRLIGLGTYRARFGRFNVEVLASDVPTIDKICDKLGIVNHSSKKKAA